ncbi:flagellar filament capping protein FliD [Lysinibacillus sp. G4S2]|uniref:flagellar filament capping protein FliD n=1 Tax=Lysinibacillus sp. G4S2 TaxID=3055859 RepID=UPI0025A1F184|nr:flagellar filament capping protein FliD [Lysinibacillus sp. G4S2]MDM5246507.1 flagellar filament capping protein FliD [Lysinibacillus sp. G4S2]
MVNRIGGLASGMDIDALVAKLMAAEKSPLIKLQQKKQTTEWMRDAYRGVNTKLKTVDRYIQDNLLNKSFMTKTATSSNSNYVTAKAGANASGTLAIEGVSQLASAARGLGKQINATGDTKLSELRISDGVIELSSIKADGSMAATGTKIEFDPNKTTVSELVEKINDSNAGVSAIFENGTLSITAKNTGDNKNGAEVQVISGADVFGKLGFDSLLGATSGDLASGGKNAVFQVNGIPTERSSNTFSISGYTVTLKDTFNAATTIENNLTAAKEELKNAQLSKDKLQALLDTAIANFDTANLAYTNKYDPVFKNSLNATEQEAYNKINNNSFFSSLTDAEMFELQSLVVDENADEQTIKDAINASSSFSTDLKSKLMSLSKDDLLLVETLDEPQLTNFKDAAQKETSLNTYKSLDKQFLSGLSATDITSITGLDFTSNETLNESINNLQDEALKTKLLKLSDTQKQSLKNLSEEDLKNYQEVATVQIPYDEKLALKVQAENNFKAGENRLKQAQATLDAAQAAADAEANKPSTAPNIPPVTMTSSTDVDEMMNKIKEFVTTYNGLVKEMNDQTKETKYRDYLPLTDEQKKEMSENEIKLWEEKAKSGLLRSDSILRSGLSSMRGLIYESNPAVGNSEYNTLYKIGITTSKSYNDGGTLAIDEDKLRNALKDDPDAVTALFTNRGNQKETVVVDGVEKTVDTRGFLQKLQGSMNSFMQDIEKKAGRATSTAQEYTIGKNLVDMDKRIDTWKDKLEKIEARYWKQFSAMEKAINKANSQSGMFAQSGRQG